MNDIPEYFYKYISRAQKAKERDDIKQLIAEIEWHKEKGLYLSFAKALLRDLKNILLWRFGEELRVQMSYSKDITDGYKCRDILWKRVHNLANSDYNYSPSKFGEGYRDTDHWEGGNDCVVLDVDDGMSIFECKQILNSNKLKGLITTTKSHQKEKNDEICDRYRVFIPTVGSFKGSAKQFSKSMERIFGLFYNQVDMATKDCARFYYGNPGGKHYYIDGRELLDWEDYSYEEVETKNLKKDYNRQSRRGGGSDIKNWFSEHLHKGNRNNTLFRAFKFYLDDGLGKEQAYQRVQEINRKCSAPLPDREVKLICRI